MIKTSHPEYILISLLLVCSSFSFFFFYFIFGQVPQLNFTEVKCVSGKYLIYFLESVSGT